MKIKRDYFEQIIVLEDDPRTRFNLGKFIVEEEGELEKIKSLTGNLSWSFESVGDAYEYFSSVRNSRKRSHILYDQLMRKIQRNFPELFQVVEFDIEKKLRKRRNMRYNLKKKMCVQIPSFYSKEEN